jgi:hypothetical protein
LVTRRVRAGRLTNRRSLREERVELVVGLARKTLPPRVRRPVERQNYFETWILALVEVLLSRDADQEAVRPLGELRDDGETDRSMGLGKERLDSPDLVADNRLETLI